MLFTFKSPCCSYRWGGPALNMERWGSKEGCGGGCCRAESWRRRRIRREVKESFRRGDIRDVTRGDSREVWCGASWEGRPAASPSAIKRGSCRAVCELFNIKHVGCQSLAGIQGLTRQALGLQIHVGFLTRAIPGIREPSGLREARGWACPGTHGAAPNPCCSLAVHVQQQRL